VTKCRLPVEFLARCRDEPAAVIGGSKRGRAFVFARAIGSGRGGWLSFPAVVRLDGAGIVLETPDGRRFRADMARAEVTIEQAGPLRACVRVAGKHASASGAMFRYVVRIHAFRGNPFVRIHYTFINDHQDELMARIDSLELVFSLAEQGGPRSILDGENGRAGRLSQVDDRGCEINGRPAGKRAAGWAAIGADRAGFAVGVRQFWQNWPKSIEVGPGVLKVGICPQFPKGLYDGKPLDEENKLCYYLRDGGVHVQDRHGPHPRVVGEIGSADGSFNWPPATANTATADASAT